MGSYSIKELERLSGIKAHTIRIWEKRYDLFDPYRTKTNIREYSDDDLKKLLKVATLSKSGLKISKIVNYSEEQVATSVAKIEDENILNEKRIDELIIAMVEFDEELFNQLYTNFVNELGVEKTFLEIIYPFLEKIGLLWLTDEIEPTQEHFISNLIRQKLCCAIDELPLVPVTAKKVILFLPEGEFHELGLLFFSFLYKLRGVKVYYLGQSTPVPQIKTLYQKINPNWVFTYTIVNPKDGVQRLIDEIAAQNFTQTFILLGNETIPQNLDIPTDIEVIKDYKEAFL